MGNCWDKVTQPWDVLLVFYICIFGKMHNETKSSTRIDMEQNRKSIFWAFSLGFVFYARIVYKGSF